MPSTIRTGLSSLAWVPSLPSKSSWPASAAPSTAVRDSPISYWTYHWKWASSCPAWSRPGLHCGPKAQLGWNLLGCPHVALHNNSKPTRFSGGFHGTYVLTPFLQFVLALWRSISSLQSKPLSPWKLMLRDGLNLYGVRYSSTPSIY